MNWREIFHFLSLFHEGVSGLTISYKSIFMVIIILEVRLSDIEVNLQSHVNIFRYNSAQLCFCKCNFFVFF